MEEDAEEDEEEDTVADEMAEDAKQDGGRWTWKLEVLPVVSSLLGSRSCCYRNEAQ